MVPGGAGGGWDLTARAMKEALEGDGLARVKVEMSPGPGGAVGLAQLLSGHQGDETTLLVGGLVMLSAAATNNLAISPLDTTPIARLTGDYPVVVVAAASPIRTLKDLMNQVRRDSSAFPWAGGSSGSLYERLAGDLYETAGVSRSALNYVPYGGGREVSESVLRGRARVGLSEAAEIEPFVARGDLRPLAVAAPARIARLDAPTMREEGFDVVAVNWRGVFAAPGISEAARDRLSDLVKAMVRTHSWKASLENRRWTDLHMSAVPFKAFIESEHTRWSEPAPSSSLPLATGEPVPASSNTGFWPAALLGLVGLVAGLVFWRRTKQAPPIPAVGPQPPTVTEVVQVEENQLPEPTALHPHVEKDAVKDAFEQWKLTPAEREIVELMLQGLRYKQIAGHRGTSERTVRQQAQVILKKAGLDGRADLAAHFLQVSRRRSA